jgi:Tfp pilus assembly protein FimT
LRLIDGFTLIELALIIALLGLVAVGVVTMTFNFKRSHLQVAAEKIRTDIEQVRSLAMTKKGTVFGVFFNDSTDQYTVYQGTVSAPIADPLTKQNLIETFSKWSGVTLTGGNYTVEFNSLGSPTTGGGGSVQITDGTSAKTITVTAGTGHVIVQ